DLDEMEGLERVAVLEHLEMVDYFWLFCFYKFLLFLFQFNYWLLLHYLLFFNLTRIVCFPRLRFSEHDSSTKCRSCRYEDVARSYLEENGLSIAETTSGDIFVPAASAIAIRERL
ncbi:hypothetical protein ACT453_24305, partial [Bacillus sp. D-CC]